MQVPGTFPLFLAMNQPMVSFMLRLAPLEERMVTMLSQVRNLLEIKNCIFFPYEM